MADMTPEQMMEAQKANCIFCKIIKGEIPSKKIFEDEHMLAILDINPATKGHILVMPKEHYPILPLVPPETFRHLFKTTHQLMAAVRKAMIVPKVTMMIANGGAAGQQSPHFLYHLIPREGGDGLDFLDAQDTKEAQPDIPAKIQQSVAGIMKAYLAREVQGGSEYAKTLLAPMMQPSSPVQQAPPQPPLPQSPLRPATPPAAQQSPVHAPPQPAAPQATRPSEPSASPADVKAQLAQVIEQNPALRELIIKDPQQVIDYVQQSPELSVLFEGVDIMALSKAFRAQTAEQLQASTSQENVQPPPAESPTIPVQPFPAPRSQEPAPSHQQSTSQQSTLSQSASPRLVEPEPIHLVDEPKPAPPTPVTSPVEAQHAPVDALSDVPDAAELSDTALMAYLDEKPKLKEIMLTDPSSLYELMKTNQRLAKFFRTQTPDQVAERLAMMGAAEEQKSLNEDEGVDFDQLSRYLGGGQ